MLSKNRVAMMAPIMQVVVVVKEEGVDYLHDVWRET
jgi:hypothetical protein